MLKLQNYNIIDLIFVHNCSIGNKTLKINVSKISVQKQNKKCAETWTFLAECTYCLLSIFSQGQNGKRSCQALSFYKERNIPCISSIRSNNGVPNIFFKFW